MFSTAQIKQIEIENMYSRGNIRELVIADIEASDFGESLFDALELLDDYLENWPSYYESKAQRVQQLQTCLDQETMEELIIELMIIVLSIDGVVPIQSVAHQLATVLNFDDIFDGIKTASEIIAVICKTDIYDIIAARDSETGSLMISSNFTLEDTTLIAINRTKYLPPMLCAPMILEANIHNGYMTKNESVILGADNHHNDYVALDAINIISAIPLSLDTTVLREQELPTKPLDTPEKVSNHARMISSSIAVYNELVDNDNVFYFTWKFDKRGRMYSQGYHVNIQSTEYKKACINFAEKFTITGV